jgi:hypothetical protein
MRSHREESLLTMSQVSQQLVLPRPISPHCRHQRCFKHQEVFGWPLGRVCTAWQRAVPDPEDQFDSAHFICLECKTHADTLFGQSETVKHINAHPHIEAHICTGKCTSTCRQLSPPTADATIMIK